MTDFEVRNPDYEKNVRAALEAQGFMKLLGVEVAEVGPGACTLAVDYRDELCQHNGLFHGGLVGTLADNAAAAAAATLVAPGWTVLTAEYKINLLAPGMGQRLEVRSRVIRPGRTLTVCESNAFAIDGEAERHCAVAHATIMNLEL